MWKGGSEQRPKTSETVLCRTRRARRACSKTCKIAVLQHLLTQVTLPRDLFFDFFMDLSSKTPTFGSFFGASPARNALKSRCFGREVHGKVNKTSHDSSGGAGRLWRSGSALGGSGGAPGGLGELWEVYIYREKNSPSTTPTDVMFICI